MEKIINKYIKKVIIEKDILNKANEMIEERCINSQVLVFVDFLAYKNYKNKIEEIKQTSLNNIVIKVLNFNELNENFDYKINETYDLIVGIGEYTLLKFTQNFAIKNNICYGFFNIFELKSEIFANFNLKKEQKLEKYPPFFIAVEDIEIKESQKFEIFCNIFKYSYLYLEYYFLIKKDENLYNFLIEYNKILNNLNKDNLIKKIVSLGLILNKYNITFFSSNDKYFSEFNNFVLSQILIIYYDNLFKKINNNNLFKCQVYDLDLGVEELEGYKNFKYDFNKFYLLSFKKRFKDLIFNVKKMYEVFVKILKETDIETFYQNVSALKKEKFINLINQNCKNLFLKKSENFEIFKKVLRF